MARGALQRDQGPRLSDRGPRPLRGQVRIRSCPLSGPVLRSRAGRPGSRTGEALASRAAGQGDRPRLHAHGRGSPRLKGGPESTPKGAPSATGAEQDLGRPPLPTGSAYGSRFGSPPDADTPDAAG